MKKQLVVLFTVLAGLGLLLAPLLSHAGGAPRISKERLRSKLGDPSWKIIDVRQGHDYTGSSQKIKGAVRENPSGVEQWAKKYDKKQTIVLYCA